MSLVDYSSSGVTGVMGSVIRKRQGAHPEKCFVDSKSGLRRWQICFFCCRRVKPESKVLKGVK